MVPVLASHISIAASAADAIDALLYNICEQGDGILVPSSYPTQNRFLEERSSDQNSPQSQIEKSKKGIRE